jgi:hypothetical protein
MGLQLNFYETSLDLFDFLEFFLEFWIFFDCLLLIQPLERRPVKVAISSSIDTSYILLCLIAKQYVPRVIF